MQALAAEGVAFEVVPGVTAASGVSACAGIPLTHRNFAQTCLCVTGHLKDGSISSQRVVTGTLAWFETAPVNMAA